MKKGILLLVLGLLIIAFGLVVRVYGLPESLYGIGVLAFLLGGGFNIVGLVRMIGVRL